MNKEKVLEIAQTKLVDLRDIQGTNVLCGKYQFKNDTVAIYYLDYSEDNISSEGLLDFQEKLISTDYYNNSGFLQWNYYLLFIRDAIDAGVKKDVEKNDLYSRKFVLSPGEFESYFKYGKAENVVKEDIVIKWKEALRKANLHEVLNKKSTYVGAVERFLNNEVPQEEQEAESTTPSSSVPIKDQHIQQLELKSSYRPYPLNRLFEFSSVNLINGVNGVGKTSLLEAIELVLCGKSNRYSQTLEPEGAISISFKGGPIDNFTPRDNAKFQARDSSWYNNTYTQRNYLPASFNRYNYFNAEASYKINSASLTEYKELLEAIALGKEFSFITERLNGFQTRLQTFDSDFTKKQSELQARISETKKQQDQLDKLANPIGLLTSLQEVLKSASWDLDSIDKIELDSSKFATSLSQAKTSIKELNVIRQHLNFENLSQLQLEETKYTDLISKTNRISWDEKILNESILKSTTESNELKFSLERLNTIKIYAQTPGSDKLLGLANKIRLTRSDILFLKDVSDKGQLIDWDSISDKQQRLSTLKESTVQSLAEKKKTNDQLEKRLKALKANLDRVSQIETEIKSLGREYLTHNHDTGECPLCSAKYSYDDLSLRINEVKSSLSQDSGITAIEDDLGNSKLEIQTLTDRAAQLAKIEVVAKLVQSDGFLTLTVSEIQSKLNESIGLLSEVEQSLQDDLDFAELMKRDELTEERLVKCIDELKNLFPDFQAFDEDALALDALVETTTRKIEDLNKSISENTEKLKTTAKELNDIASSLNTSSDTHSLTKILNERLRLLKSALLYVTEIQKCIEIPATTSFSEIDLKIKQVDDLFSNYVNGTKQSEQVKILEDIITKASVELNEIIIPKLKRVQAGLGVIAEILNQDEKEKLLKDFFASNDDQIQDIFKRIHSPRELDKVLFFTEGSNEIKILRTNGKQCGVNEISSGQRSALALSIFLTLNKKLKNGPNLLLFDDPVAFIDDLNMLSFLDYLREIVINENRQVFFATANQKLAGFFDKKFGFMKANNEFKNIMLHR